MKFLYSFILSIIFISAQAQNSVSGKITNSKDNSPIENASIYIPDLSIGAVSKTDGTYEIKNIPNGTYLVQITHINYAAQYKEMDFSGAQTANFSMETSGVELPDVIVTGVSSATEQQSNPAPVGIVGQNTFNEISWSNIIDALSKSPGVSAIDEGPGIAKPVIRGLGYNRVVTMNDGVRQEGQQFGDEFGIEVDPYTIYKAEILRGPGSLSYGSDAMAGVINLISFPTLSNGQIKGNLNLNYQTNTGLKAGSINLGGNQNGLTWDVRYTYMNCHAYQNKYDGYVFNSGFGQKDFKACIGVNKKWGYSHFTFSNFDMFTGIVEGGRDSATGEFNRHVKASDGSDSVVICTPEELKSYNHLFVIHQHVRHYKAVLDNSFAIGNGRLGLRLGFQQNHRQEANDATHGDVYNIYYFLNTINYDLRFTFPEKNKFEMAVGVNGMKQQSENRGLLFLVPAYHLFDAGVFAIGKKSFDKLSIAGGLRFDDRMMNGDDLYLDSLGVVTINVDSAIHRFDAYNSTFSGMSGSIGLVYDFTKSFYGKINLSRGFRAPNIAESGSNGIHDGTPFYEIGDPTLKPESSLQIDATLGINSKNVSTELNIFDNNINNYIFPVKLASVFGGDSIRTDVMATSDGPTFKFISGNAVLTGGEFSLNIHPEKMKWFSWENSFSTVTAIQKNQPDTTKYLPYTPPNKIETGFEFTADKICGAIKNAYFRIDVEHVFEQDKIYKKFGDETITPAYTLLNAGIGADICCKKCTLFSLYIYGSNLGDVAYQSSMSRLKYADLNNVTQRVGMYEMGRNISLKIIVPIDVKK